MAKKLPPVHTQFKKGQSGNPLGAKLHDPELKRIRKISNEMFQELVDLALSEDLSGLQKIIKDPKASALKVGVATSLVKAIQKGDWGTLERIVERLVGKVVVRVDHTTDGKEISTGANVHLYLPKNGRTKEENE